MIKCQANQQKGKKDKTTRKEIILPADSFTSYGPALLCWPYSEMTVHFVDLADQNSIANQKPMQPDEFVLLPKAFNQLDVCNIMCTWNTQYWWMILADHTSEDISGHGHEHFWLTSSYQRTLLAGSQISKGHSDRSNIQGQLWSMCMSSPATLLHSQFIPRIHQTFDQLPVLTGALHHLSCKISHHHIQ